jgi:preprotein translocase subunit SecG
MLELASPLTFFLLLNSFCTITLVLNQNDSAKDSTSVQNSTSISNPLEKFTWICLIIQLILLLIKTKITDF